MSSIILTVIIILLISTVYDKLPSFKIIPEKFNINHTYYDNCYAILIGVFTTLFHILCGDIFLTALLMFALISVTEALVISFCNLHESKSTRYGNLSPIEFLLLCDKVRPNFHIEDRKRVEEILEKLAKDNSYIIEVLKDESCHAVHFEFCIDAIKYTINNDLKY